MKVAAYIRSRRKWITHTARWVSRSQDFNPTLVPGDICRVRLERNVAGMTPDVHDYLYQVDRITKTMEGDVKIEATHFPIDEQGRSLVALDVAGTTGSGILLSSNKSGVGCDVNSSGDTTVPAETWTDGSVIDGGDIQMPPLPPPLPPGGASPADSPADGPDDTAGNPSDGMDSSESAPLTRNQATCEIEGPPCTNKLFLVSQIDDNGTPIPGTEISYAGSLPINMNINNKQVILKCLDGEGSQTPPLPGPDNCNPTNPIPAPNPGSYYGWRAQFWCGGGAHAQGDVNNTGPFVLSSTNSIIILTTGYGSSGLVEPVGSGNWIVNKRLQSTGFTGTTNGFYFYYNDTSVSPPFNLTTARILQVTSSQGSTPFIYGHIYFYPTVADYNADNPQTRVTWFGNI